MSQKIKLKRSIINRYLLASVWPIIKAMFNEPLLSRTVFKWLLIDLLSGQPKGLQVPLTFKIPPTKHFDFEQEKQLLLQIINKACSSKTTSDWGPHPYFGSMSDNEWGRLFATHIDYHLKQFNSFISWHYSQFHCLQTAQSF